MTNNITSANFTQLLTELQSSLHELQKSLQVLQNDNSEVAQISVYTLLDYTLWIEKKLERLSRAYYLTFSKMEYGHFCELLIYGCNMAGYIINNQHCSETVRYHARYWLLLAKSFKPLLENAFLN